MREVVVRRWIAGVLAASVVWLTAPFAAAQAQPGEGCDGEKERAVKVPCAGIDFCTCAYQCSKDSECASDCCSGGLCVPACVCRGEGAYDLCVFGENPEGERDSEEGGCAVSHAGHLEPDASLLAAFAALTLLRVAAGRGRKGRDRARP